MTPQEKIDEIHSILVKWESRRKWGIFFSWIYKILFLGFLTIIIFFPHVFLEKMMSILTPIVEDMAKNILETQKENFSSSLEELKNKVRF